jgi:hypothetical protein
VASATLKWEQGNEPRHGLLVLVKRDQFQLLAEGEVAFGAALSAKWKEQFCKPRQDQALCVTVEFGLGFGKRDRPMQNQPRTDCPFQVPLSSAWDSVGELAGKHQKWGQTPLQRPQKGQTNAESAENSLSLSSSRFRTTLVRFRGGT